MRWRLHDDADEHASCRADVGRVSVRLNKRGVLPTSSRSDGIIESTAKGLTVIRLP